MILRIEVAEHLKDGKVAPCVMSSFMTGGRGEDMVCNSFSQAEEVARFTEVAQEIENAVNAYYSKDTGLMPRVVRNSSTDPRTV